jgi:hypothetical protein
MPLDVVTPEIRRYLLGDLDEAAAAALEDRYVADPALLDEVRAGEDALIDAFLDARLAPRDRERFEAHYLASPVHRDRVAFARALRERSAAPVASPAGGRFYGWLALAAALVLASLWIVSRSGPPQQAAAPPPSPPSQAAPPIHPAPVTPAPGPPPVTAPTPAPPTLARSVLALTLSPISTRGGEPQATHVRPAGPVDLVLRLEGTADPSDRAYDAELQTVDGRRVWRGRSRAGDARSGLLTTVRVPADGLAADDYVVVIATLAGAERGRYVLRLRSR